MTFIKTKNRLDVIESLINVALKDSTPYCNNCDKNYDGSQCCDDPQVGTHIEHVKALIIDNELIKERNLHETGKSAEGTMRLAFRLPPRIYHILHNYFKAYGEKFPKDTEELYALMKRFNKFCAVEKI